MSVHVTESNEPDVIFEPRSGKDQSVNTRLSGLEKVASASEPVATVAIPDVRAQSEQVFTEEPRTPTEVLTELDAIKRAIEQTIDGGASESTVEKLQTEIRAPRPVQKAEGKSSITNKLAGPDRTVDDSGKTASFQPEKDLDESECFLARLDPQDSQIRPIVDSILEKFPKGGFNIISFAGSEKNSQLESVVARTATVVENEVNGKILVIDFDIDNKTSVESLGLADLGKQGVGWKQIVQTTSKSNIDFVSVGRIDGSFNAARAIRNTVEALGSEYNFVLVNVGDAHAISAEAWAKHVHGTFLLVSMTKSNQEIAKSAVAQLNVYGARLIGCVVSQPEEGE